MASAWVTPPPPPHLSRLYHLATWRHAVSDIENSRLKVLTRTDSNDSFELLAIWIGDREIRTVVQDHKKRLDSELRLLRFSANWSSPPLRSHCTERHKGICVGFDIPSTKVIEVSYSKAPLKDQTNEILQRRNINTAVRDLLICTKFNDWSYEQEYRMQVSLNKAIKSTGIFFSQFGRELVLKDVILGPLANTSEVRRVRSIVDSKYPNAVTFKARLAFQSYGVVPDERTVP